MTAKKPGWWLRLALGAACLWVVAGCTVTAGARQPAYRELAGWLSTHALPGETVGVQEPEAWARLTGFAPVALPLGGDAFALLDRLQASAPDYCVALRSVAWDGVLATPWFQEHYTPIAAAVAAEDTASPLTLYRYRHSPFDMGDLSSLDHTLQDATVGTLTVHSVRLNSTRLAPGEPVYASVTLAGDLREPLTAIWQVRDPATDHVWRRESHPRPGGAPTDLWSTHGTVTERFVVMPPVGATPGDLALELAFVRPNGAPFGSPVSVATLVWPPDVARVSPTPDYPLRIAAGEGVTLMGYDAPDYVAPGSELRVALYWHAAASVDRDRKVFVHVLDAAGALAAQSDAAPVHWTYPTTAWQPGDYVRDVHAIALDATLPRGDYRITTGMYDAETGERLPLHDAQGIPLPDHVAQLYTLHVR